MATNNIRGRMHWMCRMSWKNDHDLQKFSLWLLAELKCHISISEKLPWKIVIKMQHVGPSPMVNIPIGATIRGHLCYFMVLSLCFIGSIYTQFLPTIASAKPFPCVTCYNCIQNPAWQQGLAAAPPSPWVEAGWGHLLSPEWGAALCSAGCSLINYCRLLYTMHVEIWVLKYSTLCICLS